MVIGHISRCFPMYENKILKCSYLGVHNKEEKVVVAVKDVVVEVVVIQ